MWHFCVSLVSNIFPEFINGFKLINQVHEELVQAIKDAEEGLFHLKRARLLQETNLALQSTKYTAIDVKVEPLDPTDVQAEPLEDLSYSVGSKCRFRHTDGRWYNGIIIGLEEFDDAKVSFLTPTSENMLVSIYFYSFLLRI